MTTAHTEGSDRATVEAVPRTSFVNGSLPSFEAAINRIPEKAFERAFTGGWKFLSHADHFLWLVCEEQAQQIELWYSGESVHALVGHIPNPGHRYVLDLLLMMCVRGLLCGRTQAERGVLLPQCQFDMPEFRALFNSLKFPDVGS